MCSGAGFILPERAGLQIFAVKRRGMVMSYTQNVDACFDDKIGDLGVSRADVEAHSDTLSAGIAKLQAHYDNNTLPLLRLPERQDDLAEMRVVADDYADRFDDVVVFGTGGSSLGAESLQALTNPDQRGSLPRVHIVSSIDPFIFGRVISGLDLAKTGWIIVSKSGGTAETLMQFLTILPMVRNAMSDDALPKHITVITEPGEGALRRLAQRFNLPILDHDPLVGGRFSVLSVVGLLPAMLCGLDASAVRAGAGSVLDTLLNAASDPLNAPPALGAAVGMTLNAKKNINASVLLAYADRLGSLTRWYRQLWAESLGKEGKGTTPIDGMGPVDQHSQVQLWLDGPNDKMFTIIGAPPEHGLDSAFRFPGIHPALADLVDADYIKNRDLGDLMTASRRGTTGALIGRGKPVRTIDMQDTGESSMGAVMMHFMLETILAADLIGVDAFDQPAVEDGKHLTRKFLVEPDA